MSISRKKLKNRYKDYLDHVGFRYLFNKLGCCRGKNIGHLFYVPKEFAKDSRLDRFRINNMQVGGFDISRLNGMVYCEDTYELKALYLTVRQRVEEHKALNDK